MKYISKSIGMKASIIMLLASCSTTVSAQGWGSALPCHFNVNDPFGPLATGYRRPVIDATFKIRYPNGTCTGTLINRNVSDDEIGFYFLTAKHCHKDVDFSANLGLIFNYQSPDGITINTAPDNMGVTYAQSGSADMGTTSNGYEYLHNSKVEVLAEFPWGDIALCRIVTPIPPHFEIAYAGWNPNRFYSGGNLTADGSDQRYATIHHPRGDIKKISTARSVKWLEMPWATGCYTITKVIDVLFGWIWKRRFSTSVICNYIDNPFLEVYPWHFGLSEEGSSGAGLFNASNRLIGVLKGFPTSGCVITVPDGFGKLHANYANAKMRNTLNPNHDLWTEWYGMSPRRIYCYDNLNLPGELVRSGNYFPAQDYRQGNLVTLRARDHISAAQVRDIHIYPNANYTFTAGNAIDLGPHFDAKAGAVFIAELGGCMGLKEPDNKPDFAELLSRIDVPQNKAFDIQKYTSGTILKSDEIYAEMYPNPTSGDFVIKFNNEGTYKIEVVNMVGISVHQTTVENSAEAKVKLPVELPPGQYIVRVNNTTNVFTGKIILKN